MVTSKHTYFHVDLERGTIRFPSRVECAATEAVLSEAYQKSFQKKYTTICFDLSGTVWCDLFPLTLIVNWILSLRKAGKIIEFHFPKDPEVQSFLKSYRFEKFLDENQVSKSGSTMERIRLSPNNLLRASFFPLTFFSEESFRNLLQDLYVGDRLKTVFASVEDADVVKTGAIRDVILSELGDNIYVHAKGEGAHISMTKYPRLHSRIVYPLDEIDARFFNKLRGQEVIEIVISDIGEGIRNTLLNSYITDDAIPNKSTEPTDCELIDYALLYYTSRRSVSERIGKIKDVISSDALKFPPVTGLHRLKETVRDYHGLLYIRSGAGIVAYDFFNQQHDVPPFRSDTLPKSHSLKNINGTQYRILLPLRKPLPSESQSFFSFNQTKSIESGTYEYLGVADYFCKYKHGEAQAAAEALDEIFQHLNTFITVYKGKKVTIIVDFQGCEQYYSKALHYLIYDIMQRQGKYQRYVIINHSMDRDIHFLNNVKGGNLRSVLAYDKDGNIHLIPEREEDSYLIGGLFDENKSISNSVRKIAENSPHICTYDMRTDRYVPIISYKQAMNITCNAIGKKLRTAIVEQVFDASIKVLLPSQRYSTGYFETYKIYSNPSLYELLKRYLSLSLQKELPDYIISIGAGVGLWVSSVLSEHPFPKNLLKQHINLPTGSKGHISISPILGIEKAVKVIIISDVLGTCQTVSKLISNISQTHVIKIITIVNASEDTDTVLQFKDKEIEIEAIARKKLTYYNYLPPDWSYSEVHQVDPQTHLLIKNVTKINGPLFKSISTDDGGMPINEFIRDIVEPSNGFREGHFYSRSNHSVYLFDIPKINNFFINQISDFILNDIREVEKVLTDNKQDPITHALYPHYNPGMDTLTKMVASQFMGCRVVKISEEEFQSSFDQDYEKEDIHKVVILDDATVTGETIFRMIDICERKGAKFIYVYIITTVRLLIE